MIIAKTDIGRNAVAQSAKLRVGHHTPLGLFFMCADCSHHGLDVAIHYPARVCHGVSQYQCI